MDEAKDADPVAAAAQKEEEIREEHDAALKIVEEFQYLLEKSQQLFAGLRDLPPTGGKQWQPYFQRTFEVYTKLWKFQQQHRFILENKENYGLKRWEVGEIASKVGQLYYHYYLRTSETNYLNESFVFYEAIRERAYFKDILDARNPPLMIKKLRYYARYIVVCLLLNQRALVKTLMDELNSLVDDYVKAFKNQSDTGEWQMVLQEIATFLEAEKKIVPVDPSQNSLPVLHRVQPDRFKSEKDGATKLKLQEAILVGNYQNQIKFSELTLDMYRMLQSLEREPATHSKPVTAENKDDGAAAADGEQPVLSGRRLNPHKYLLYRPSLSQLLVYISNAFKEINENAAMLLYLSADGAKRMTKGELNSENFLSGFSGGVATNSRRGAGVADKSDGSDQSALVHCLHPNDLLPFTRKPLFLIVDSNNSVAFKSFGKVFNQALMCLMSPTEYPSSIRETSQVGSLFTLFLHAPILGVCYVGEVTEAQPDAWEKAVTLISNLEQTIAAQLAAANLEKPVKRFIQEDFLRLYIVRFLICHAVLSSHNSFTEPKYLPSSLPVLPPSLISSREILAGVKELVELLKIGSSFTFNELPQGASASSDEPATAAGDVSAPAPETAPTTTSEAAAN